MIRERAIEERTSMSEAYDEGYEQGVADSNGEMTWVETNVIKEANQILGEVNSIYQRGYSDGYQQGRADAIEETCKQIRERVEYWDSCAKAMEKGSNEYKIFISLAKNFDELAEQLKEK